MQPAIFSPPIETIPASVAHRGFGKLLRRVYTSNQPLVIERAGFPVVVMLSYGEYEKFRRSQAIKHFQDLTKKLSSEAKKQNLTEEQLYQELRDVRKKVFQETYGRLS